MTYFPIDLSSFHLDMDVELLWPVCDLLHAAVGLGTSCSGTYMITTIYLKAINFMCIPMKLNATKPVGKALRGGVRVGGGRHLTGARVARPELGQ